MMLSDEQVIERLRAALREESAGIEPSPTLLISVHRELAAGPGRERRRRPEHRGYARKRWGEWLSVALAAGVAAAVVAVVLLVGHRDGSSPARTVTVTSAVPHPGPSLPRGVPAGPERPPEARIAAIPNTVRTVAYAPDPHGGPVWGLREFRIADGETCVQIGRVANGTIGVLGQDNAWLNDGRFHPIAPNAYTGRTCAPEDRQGNAFLNVSTHTGIASAAVDWGVKRQSHDCNRGSGPASQPPCPRRDLRDLDYGLLGPAAVSIEYIRPNGVHVVQPTTGPDGAYLIVGPASPKPCVLNRNGTRGCSSGGETQSPSLQSGTIVAVHYRDGHTCQLPAATHTGVRQTTCPPVGYVTPQTAHLTAGAVARPITIRMLPYKRAYCGGDGHGFRICRPGETPLAGTSDERLIDLSFTAAVAANGTTSSYQFTDSYAAGGTKKCPGGGSGGGPSNLRVRAGQHVTYQDQIPVTCTGPVTGTITYTPNTGPGGAAAGPVAPNHRPDRLLVGRFRFRMP